jgi:hypothetical protein
MNLLFHNVDPTAVQIDEVRRQLLAEGVPSDQVDERLDDLLPVRTDDALWDLGTKRYNIVVTNPPFGRKSSITVIGEEGDLGSEAISYERDDFWATTSSKQLNFLSCSQHSARGGWPAIAIPAIATAESSSHRQDLTSHGREYVPPPPLAFQPPPLPLPPQGFNGQEAVEVYAPWPDDQIEDTDAHGTCTDRRLTIRHVDRQMITADCHLRRGIRHLYAHASAAASTVQPARSSPTFTPPWRWIVNAILIATALILAILILAILMLVIGILRAFRARMSASAVADRTLRPGRAPSSPIDQRTAWRWRRPLPRPHRRPGGDSRRPVPCDSCQPPLVRLAASTAAGWTL